MVVQQKLLEKAYFIIKPTGRAMVQPASSDEWKAPQDWHEMKVKLAFATRKAWVI